MMCVFNVSILCLFFFQLDSLSREDLVKFVKRQTILLQKIKAKNTGKNSNVIKNISVIPMVVCTNLVSDLDYIEIMAYCVNEVFNMETLHIKLLLKKQNIRYT